MPKDIVIVVGVNAAGQKILSEITTALEALAKYKLVTPFEAAKITKRVNALLLPYIEVKS